MIPDHDVDKWLTELLRGNRRRMMVRRVARWTCAIVVIAVLLAGAVASVAREIWLWQQWMDAE